MSLSSVLLLVIFVSAAALILAAIIWRPWFGDDAADVDAPLPEAQAPAHNGETAPEVAAEAPAEQ